MTLGRLQRKLAWALRMGLVLAVWGGCGALPAGAAAEPVVVNAQTGLAISGFDPVAYFTDRRPEVGSPDLELRQDGVVWRFRNEGNRAAFAAHPEVYTPRFGGYDPVALSRGVSVPGHPYYWTLTGERLYLFYSAKARNVFLAQPGNIIAAADRQWPKVMQSLSP
jgi:hypothetical protein